MSEVKYTTAAKILKVLGYILMMASVFLIMIGISGFFMGPIHPAIDPLYMLFSGLLLFMASLPILMMSQTGIVKPEFDVISLLRCSNADCKFTKGRKFEKDEYVFKELDEKCEKCNSNFYIAAIFEVERKPSKKKEEKTMNMKEVEKDSKQEESPAPKTPS